MLISITIKRGRRKTKKCVGCQMDLNGGDSMDARGARVSIQLFQCSMSNRYEITYLCHVVLLWHKPAAPNSTWPCQLDSQSATIFRRCVSKGDEYSYGLYHLIFLDASSVYFIADVIQMINYSYWSVNW